MAKTSLHIVSKPLGGQPRIIHIIFGRGPRKKGKSPSVRAFTASFCFTFADVPSTKADPMAKPRSRETEIDSISGLKELQVRNIQKGMFPEMFLEILLPTTGSNLISVFSEIILFHSS